MAEGNAAYDAFFGEGAAAARALLLETNNLRTIGNAATYEGSFPLIDSARYTAGPPISRDDLSALSDVPNSFRRLDAAGARRVSLVLGPGIDKQRFPWLFDNPPREPTPNETAAAVMATATVWAAQRMATKRRGESSQRQEAAVRQLLKNEDFTQVARRNIDRIDDLARGEFCPEAMVAGTKSDIPIRLRNGLLLLIECKVSGSAINSYKRLNHEVGDKQQTWGRAFGEQAFTMAVLAGVFRLGNLIEAQDTKHIYIAWERDLDPLAQFLRASV
jgi:hypothetical protein